MYPGGKGGPGVYQNIINQMPPHRVYIEAFLGGGSILLHKRPSSCSIAIERDTAVAARWTGREIPNLTIVQGDALRYLRMYKWQGDELVYCDPPYLMETRSSKRDIYRHEMTVQDHKRLLALLKTIRASVIISGYWSDLYASELMGWRTANFRTVARSGKPVTEWIWMNFPPPLKLHDYRYLGQSFRERERIKRRQQRWRSRLNRMPDLERHALLAVIQELK
jgi:DNA adenine methylase